MEPNSNDLVKMKLVTGGSIYVDLQFCHFICTKCQAKPQIKSIPSIASKSTPSRQTPSKAPPTAKAMAGLQAELSKLTEVMSSANAKINEIDATTKSTSSKLNEIASKNVSLGNTPRPSYASMLQAHANSPFSNGAVPKRRRNENALNAETPRRPPLQVPTPKCGSNAVTIGPPVSVGEKSSGTRFDKSLWVSKLHPTVTAEEISEYLVKNTPLKDATKFYCKRLTKKDQDLSQLAFISFKIDVSREDFELISSESYWPSNVAIREFVKLDRPAPTFVAARLTSPPLQPSPKIPRTTQAETPLAEPMPVNQNL